MSTRKEITDEMLEQVAGGAFDYAYSAKKGYGIFRSDEFSQKYKVYGSAKNEASDYLHKSHPGMSDLQIAEYMVSKGWAEKM